MKYCPHSATHLTWRSGLNCVAPPNPPAPPPNSYVEALTPNAIIFGDGTLKEVIKGT